LDESEASPAVKEVFQDIKATRALSFVPNLWRAMAHNPEYLAASWSRFKAVMAPGRLDARTKEVIALAVSAVNNCEYCLNAHAATLKKMGLDDEGIVEIMAVVDLICGLNKFAEGLRIEPSLRP